MTHTLTEAQFIDGFSKTLKKNDQFKINISDSWHSVKLTGLTVNSVTVNVSSTPQQASINIGESRFFDVTGDGSYDLNVKLEGIGIFNNSATNATINIKKYAAGDSGSAAVTGEAVKTEEKEEQAPAPEEEVKEKTSSLIWVVIIAIIVIFVVAVFIIYNKKRYSKKGY